MAEKAVFLDRDGTLIEDVGYLSDPEGLLIFDEAFEAVRSLREIGMKIVVVTNQSGIARGLFDEPTLDEIHDNLRAAFRHQGAPLDAIFHCPYHPDAEVQRYRRHSSLRKPAPGMLRQAALTMEIDLARSFMIGDTLKDIVAGHRAGCLSILVRTGKGREALSTLKDLPSLDPTLSPAKAQPDYIAEDVLKAADWIRQA